MKLFEFLESFNVTTDVTISYYGCVEYTGKINDIPFKEMVGKTVTPGQTTISDNTMIICVENEIRKHRNS